MNELFYSLFYSCLLCFSSFFPINFLGVFAVQHFGGTIKWYINKVDIDTVLSPGLKLHPYNMNNPPIVHLIIPSLVGFSSSWFQSPVKAPCKLSSCVFLKSGSIEPLYSKGLMEVVLLRLPSFWQVVVFLLRTSEVQLCQSINFRKSRTGSKCLSLHSWCQNHRWTPVTSHRK